MLAECRTSVTGRQNDGTFKVATPPHRPPPLTTLRSSGLPLDRVLTEHCASKPRKSTEEREGRVGTPTLCNVLGTRRNLSTPPVAWKALFIQCSYLLCHKTRTAADTDILKPDAGAFPSFCGSFFLFCVFWFFLTTHISLLKQYSTRFPEGHTRTRKIHHH